MERAAAVLQLSRRRTQELAAGGLLGGQRVGRQWILDEVAVREFARQRRKGST
ncbi:MAG: helix-turn-helix domain-containing protein [Pseudonocardiaceae bacterium]